MLKLLETKSMERSNDEDRNKSGQTHSVRDEECPVPVPREETEAYSPLLMPSVSDADEDDTESIHVNSPNPDGSDSLANSATVTSHWFNAQDGDFKFSWDCSQEDTKKNASTSFKVESAVQTASMRSSVSETDVSVPEKQTADFTSDGNVSKSSSGADISRGHIVTSSDEDLPEGENCEEKPELCAASSRQNEMQPSKTSSTPKAQSKQGASSSFQKPSLGENRRQKNNEAAKRSRDMRRAKEDGVAVRCALLEAENVQLRLEMAWLKNETGRLKYMLYST